ncbi:ATP-binding protein [Bacteroides helcogenes]|uniref:histidine kinase n=1 Tax=Bacteroides helcogenes (strain ATCC 35417 / DSM 20613 / JCM 6297 / CCUG 15421 / P 36-108) TaxID=693979 RepID=E6SQX5_BACT6|nr:ATP-binding protein [Bacteroides helcogenes]ADV45044.1 histidine kinase [Bacteroides helcogenes P 36-108]MDY5239902.1 ATP-binding protein [Bacteroides helcogenes]
MNKTFSHITTLLLCTVFLQLMPLSAQNNVYKIDDSLYPYLVKCTKAVRSPQVLLMADTLFHMAECKGDQKAQCLALHQKVDYYYYKGNLSALQDAVRTLRGFAVRTPFQQYVFSGWNRIIAYWKMKVMYVKALEEVNDYQAEARRLNNPYGIGFSFQHFSSIYKMQASYELAMKYAVQGAEYIEQHGNPGDAVSLYLTAGESCQMLRDDAKALGYLKKALSLAPDPTRRVQPLCYLVGLYLSSGSMQDLVESKKCLDEMNRITEKHPVFGGMLLNCQMGNADYYMAVGDYERAATIINTLPHDNISYFDCMKRLSRLQGRYEESLSWCDKCDSIKRNEDDVERHRMLTEYTARFDNTRLETEKNRLALQNSEMRIRQLADEHRLMETDKERDRLALQATELKLKNSDLALRQRMIEVERNRTEALHQQERAASAEERGRMQMFITSVLLLLSVSLIVFIFVYTLQRRKSIVRLQKERNIALRARNESEAARKEAEHAREVAEYANRQKSIFLQNMSHEIRTPLNAIVGFSDVVNSEEDLGLTVEERADYLSLIHTNTELLTTLVNDVLDLSKLESGSYALALAPTCISDLCHATLRSIASRVPDGVQLKLDEPEDASFISFLTDAVRLQQVITNFLTNACKYTDRGSITLKYRIQEDGGIVFSVTDTGCGISEDKAEIVFGRFEKLDTFKQGTGLGLSICRHIAELVGGRVYLDTTYTGGARFVFVHPELKQPVA